MVDKNKLNRIKGILSSKQGAEIPKFLNPSGPIQRLFYTMWDPNSQSHKYYLDGLEVTEQLFFNDKRVRKDFKNTYSLDNKGVKTNYTPVNAISTGPTNTSSQYLVDGIPMSEERYWANASFSPNTMYLDRVSGNTIPSEIQLETPNSAAVGNQAPLGSMYNSRVGYTMAIPGDPGIDPNTAVEHSAAVNAMATDPRLEARAKYEAAAAIHEKYKPESVSSLLPSQESLNTDLKTRVAADVKAAQVTGLSAESEKNIQNAASAYMEKIEAEKAKASNNQKIVDMAASLGALAFTTIGDAFGSAQLATDSNLTKGITAGYKGIQNVVSNLGPIGLAAGTIMGIASATGDMLLALGGGTDQQSTLDKWMDSPLLSWNIGAINGFFGKNSDKFNIDSDVVENVGSSYGGTVTDLHDAVENSNKKYGLFSYKSRKKANDAITKAKAAQNLMTDIGDAAEDQRLAIQSMGELAGLAYSMMTGGGYDLKYTYAAKQGGILEWNPVDTLEWEPQVELNWELPEFKEGGSIDLIEELEWIPELQKGDKTRTLELLFEYAKKENPRFIQRFSETPRGITFIDDDGNEAEGSHYLEWATDDRGAVVYPRIQEMDDGSLKFLSGKEAWERANKNNNILIMSPQEAEMFFAEDPEYHTAYKRGWPDFFKSYKKGGVLGNNGIPEIEETTQKNVIPEGALHKNKHHMEHAEGLTKKGIPVIDDDGELLAEIEHSEIIFTLEVTKKLEEYYEIFYSDSSSNSEKEQAAIEAGKLLVFQILENTEDRTGLIESCKKGGTLTLKTTADDLIEEVLEWIPTLVMVEEEKVIEKPKKDSKKDEKEVMKEAIKEVLIELLTK